MERNDERRSNNSAAVQHLERHLARVILPSEMRIVGHCLILAAVACSARQPATGRGSPSELTTQPTSSNMISYPACQLLEQGKLRTIGRFDCGTDALRFAWSGSGVELRFRGTGLRLRYSGPALRFARVVDGAVQADVFVSEGHSSFLVADGLIPGEHVAVVLRQSEALFGTSSLTGVEVLGGELLTIDSSTTPRLEIYGDSISCGYGNEGKNVDCTFSQRTENHFLSYGSLLARSLGAELTTIAWSGKGVARNFAGQPGPTLVDLAGRALPEEEPSWTTESPPRAVLINLGTNDFSTDPDPSLPDFVQEYVRLLDGIRSVYPETFILCTVGPMLSGPDLHLARRGIQEAVATRRALGDLHIAVHEMTTTNQEPGCDWHPSLHTHRRMADELFMHLRGHFLQPQAAVPSPAPPRKMK